MTLRYWAAPRQLLLTDGRVSGMRFVRTRLEGAKLVETGESFELPADVVLRAIGQNFVAEPIGSAIALQDGRIATDEHGHTSHPKVWAGGDCRAGGRDLTVEAVEHGKLAAIDIDRVLRA